METSWPRHFSMARSGGGGANDATARATIPPYPATATDARFRFFRPREWRYIAALPPGNAIWSRTQVIEQSSVAQIDFPGGSCDVAPFPVVEKSRNRAAVAVPGYGGS